MSQSRSLNEQCQATVANFMQNLAEPQRQTVTQSFEKIMQSDLGIKAKRPGDAAPTFALTNSRGGMTELPDLLGQGPLVISFYRGGWCPFCNLEFRALTAILPEIQSLGANLIGISPETPQNTKETVRVHALGFDVLSDIGNKTARGYGLLMEVFEEMRPLYLEWGMDIPAANGDASYEIPIPATYVIATDGTIVAAHVDKNYTMRMEPVDILDALRNL